MVFAAFFQAVVLPEPARAALTPGTLNVGPAGAETTMVSARGYLLRRDGAMSVPVSSKRSLWVFADSIRFNSTGGLMDGTLLGNAAITNNDIDPALTWESVNAAGKLYSLLPGAVEVCPAPQKPFAWPSSVSGVPQADPDLTLIVIYYSALCGQPGPDFPTPKHMGVATFMYDNKTPYAPIQATVLNQNLGALSPGFGQASVFNPADGFVYVYGCSAIPCRLGRVSPNAVGNLANYRFWNGSAWVADATSAIAVGMGGEYSLTPSVQWLPKIGRFVSLAYTGSPDFQIRVASKPEGPWSATSTVTIADCSSLCMTTGVQMALSDASTLALTYVPYSTHVPHIVEVPMLINPIGVFESATAAIGGVNLKGWAIDPDVATAVPVAVFVDGIGAGFFTANVLRPDVGSTFLLYGAAHGFNVLVPTAVGTHSVCVSAVNGGIGASGTPLGCKTVTVLSPPSAPLSTAATSGDKAALVSWSPPSDTGGATISELTYSVSVFPTIAASPLLVSPGTTSLLVGGLTNGTAYTFQVKATNSAGTGPASVATTAVTPLAIAGVRFHPMSPDRFLDSRTGIGWSGKVTAGGPRNLQVAGVSGIPATASAVVMNVTVTGSSANSFVTVYPTGQPVPTASNLNFATGETIANLTTVKVGLAGKVGFATEVGATHIVADVVGWYDDGSVAGDKFNSKAPVRFLDSRTGAGWSGMLAANGPRNLQITGVSGVPVEATAVVMNVTVTNSTANSFVTVWPNGQTLPTASNLNFAAGQTIANLTTVKIGTAGKVAFATANGSTNVVADVVGWYQPGTGDLFHPLLAPTRILDDRYGTGGFFTPVSQLAARPVIVGSANGVPPEAAAVVANTTVTNSSANSFVTLYPSGQSLPNASNLNFAAGQTIPNLAVVKLGTAGKVDVATAQGTVTAIIDVSGYFSPG